jgi:hypothetical protein
MPEPQSDYQAFRRSYRWLLLYGPWALAGFGLLLAGVSALVHRPSAVVVAAIGLVLRCSSQVCSCQGWPGRLKSGPP